MKFGPGKLNVGKYDLTTLELSPLERQIYIPKRDKPISEGKFNGLLKQGAIKYGVYASSSRCVGEGMSLVQPRSFCTLQPAFQNVYQEHFERNWFMPIIRVKDKKAKEAVYQSILRDLEKSPELKFYVVDVLLQGIDKYKKDLREIYNVITRAGAYTFLWHHQSSKQAKDLISIVGETFLNCRFPNGTNALMQVALNQIPGGITRFEQLIKSGIDINACHPKFGSVWHIIIANEYKLGSYLESYKRAYQQKWLVVNGTLTSQVTPPNLKIKDSVGGNTPLLLACKTRRSEAVSSLLSLGEEIGINEQDPLGRTPLMISAALGDVKSFSLLLKNGARVDIQDAAGRNINWYIQHAGEKAIKSIFKEVDIEPERFHWAPHNWVYSNDAIHSPLVCSQSDERDKMVMISPKNKDLLHAVVAKALIDGKPTGDISLYAHVYSQIKPFLLGTDTDQTLSAHCLAQKASISVVFASWYKEQKSLSHMPSTTMNKAFVELEERDLLAQPDRGLLVSAYPSSPLRLPNISPLVENTPYLDTTVPLFDLRKSSKTESSQLISSDETLTQAFTRLTLSG